MSRVVVKPARRLACRLWMAMRVDVSRDIPGFGGLKICVCASLSPGRTVAWLRSITCASVGIFTEAAGPTSVMRSPSSTTTWFTSIWPVLLSNSRPARTATTPLGCGHMCEPPSAPKHGFSPAPRQGAFAPPSCAQSGLARAANPINPRAADFAAVDFSADRSRIA
jgi:hypothetical protein